MEGVDGGGHTMRERGEAPEHPGLRLVRVHDVRSEAPDRTLDLGQRVDVVPGVGRPAQPSDPLDRDVRRPQGQVVALVWSDRAGEEPVFEAIGVQPPGENRRLECGSADVEAIDDPQYANSHDSDDPSYRVA